MISRKIKIEIIRLVQMVESSHDRLRLSQLVQSRAQSRQIIHSQQINRIEINTTTHSLDNGMLRLTAATVSQISQRIASANIFPQRHILTGNLSYPLLHIIVCKVGIELRRRADI